MSLFILYDIFVVASYYFIVNESCVNGNAILLAIRNFKIPNFVTLHGRHFVYGEPFDVVLCSS